MIAAVCFGGTDCPMAGGLDLFGACDVGLFAKCLLSEFDEGLRLLWDLFMSSTGIADTSSWIKGTIWG